MGARPRDPDAVPRPAAGAARAGRCAARARRRTRRTRRSECGRRAGRSDPVHAGSGLRPRHAAWRAREPRLRRRRDLCDDGAERRRKVHDGADLGRPAGTAGGPRARARRPRSGRQRRRAPRVEEPRAARPRRHGVPGAGAPVRHLERARRGGAWPQVHGQGPGRGVSHRRSDAGPARSCPLRQGQPLHAVGRREAAAVGRLDACGRPQGAHHGRTDFRAGLRDVDRDGEAHRHGPRRGLRRDHGHA